MQAAEQAKQEDIAKNAEFHRASPEVESYEAKSHVRSNGTLALNLHMGGRGIRPTFGLGHRRMMWAAGNSKVRSPSSPWTLRGEHATSSRRKCTPLSGGCAIPFSGNVRIQLRSNDLTSRAIRLRLLSGSSTDRRNSPARFADRKWLFLPSSHKGPPEHSRSPPQCCHRCTRRRGALQPC